VETLFGAEGRYPASTVKLELASWRTPEDFAELLMALAVLHNRILILRKCKTDTRKGQLLHPALYLPADELLVIKNFPADGQPFEFYAYPAIARTVARLEHLGVGRDTDAVRELNARLVVVGCVVDGIRKLGTRAIGDRQARIGARDDGEAQ